MLAGCLKGCIWGLAAVIVSWIKHLSLMKDCRVDDSFTGETFAYKGKKYDRHKFIQETINDIEGCSDNKLYDMLESYTGYIRKGKEVEYYEAQCEAVRFVLGIEPKAAKTAAPLASPVSAPAAPIIINAGASVSVSASDAQKAADVSDASPTLSYCPHCGVKLAENSTFCARCGRKLSESAPTAVEDVFAAELSAAPTPIITDEPQ